MIAPDYTSTKGNAMNRSTKQKRLRKLAKKIEKHEELFDMGTYFEDRTDLSPEKVIEKIIEKRRPICGTSGCAAGWAVILFGTKEQIKSCIQDDDDWSTTAQKLLGMTDRERDIFSRISSSAESVANKLREMADVQ
jgi:hypothetical protein